MRIALGAVLALLIAACNRSDAGLPTTTSGTIATASAVPPGAKPQPKTFLIFADVTRSLTPDEQRSVVANVQRVIEIVPDRSRVMVFPILEDVQRAGSLFSDALGEVQGTSDAVAVAQQRAAWKKQVEDKLNAIFKSPPTGRTRTCISGALQKADEIIAETVVDAEIVIVSDMLEDCDDSLVGGRVGLEKLSITDEIKRAKALPPDALLHLNGANVTAILPTMPMSKPNVQGPPVSSLRAFWRIILDHCGDTGANFRFGTEIPQRLLDLRPPVEGPM